MTDQTTTQHPTITPPSIGEWRIDRQPLEDLIQATPVVGAVCAALEHWEDLDLKPGSKAAAIRDDIRAALEQSRQDAAGLTVDELARVIWDASRADEGTISATGANVVARAVVAALAVTR